MEKVKLVNKKTKIVKEINKIFASDYLGTKEWEIAKKEERKYEIPKNPIYRKENKEEK